MTKTYFTAGRLVRISLGVVAVLLLAAVGAVAAGWLPGAESWWGRWGDAALVPGEQSEHDHDVHKHGGHNHDSATSHPGHDDASALQLSSVAWKNIGLKTGTVEPRTFARSVSVPAMVVERPGRSQVEITSPMTGIVARVYPLEGEAVQPGQSLFDLRLTHEDLVTAQREFLQSAQDLDIIEREMSRLRGISEGVIAGRQILEKQYEADKLEAALHAQRQGLLLHGLTAAQIDSIMESRQLLQTVTVSAPPFDESADHHDVEHLYHVQKIAVRRGTHVVAGDSLGTLGDHCLLYVEGQAFEDDAQRLIKAARDNWPVTVSPVAAAGEGIEEQLKILYVADHVNPQSRALHFYLGLPNHLIRDERESDHRFVAWRYRPGQRMEVEIPLGEPWENQIVLPPEAVVEEGADAFVFEQNGDHFDRLPVHVLYRDKDAVVVENDGALAGSTLAMSGAYQMHLALKNKSGSGVDPHAGHSH